MQENTQIYTQRYVHKFCSDTAALDLEGNVPNYDIFLLRIL